MKLIHVAVLIVGIAFVGCGHSNNDKAQIDAQKGVKVISQKPSNAMLIIPGKSIDKIYLGQPVDELGKLLGKADFSDAAMGKAWSVWYEKLPKDSLEQFAIYSSYRDTSLTIKDVKQIRTASSKYETINGLSVNKTFNEIRKVYPAMLLLNEYLNSKTNDTIKLYDLKKEGISFEFIAGKCTAISVHPKNVAANHTYLVLHPEWKSL